jgi:DNA-directed RNA polymerase subunit RPC12/RpoP
MSIYDSQNKARMYMSKEKFRANFPAFRLGTEDIELLEYAPVRKGRWTEIEGDYWNEDIIYQCSVCKEEFVSFDGTNLEKLWNYCPNCGCKMEV